MKAVVRKEFDRREVMMVSLAEIVNPAQKMINEKKCSEHD
jgi:hypothetical protein